MICFSIVWSGIERGHRLLEDEADLVAAHPAQHSASGAPTISRPSNFAEPLIAAASVISDSVDSAVTDLPDPLSPTSASVSPGAMAKLTPFTASTSSPPSWRKATFRSRDLQQAHWKVFRGSKASRTPSKMKIKRHSISPVEVKAAKVRRGACRFCCACAASSPSEG